MIFDAHTYFEKEVRDKMKLAVNGNYQYSRVSSMQHLEEVIDGFRYHKAFFAVDDTEDGFTFQKGGGYMDRKTIVVYVLKQYRYGDMQSQKDALAECRKIYKTVLKKLIRDKSRLENDMVYLVTERIPYNEIPGYFANGCTGLFFIIPVNIPTNLCYDSEEWL
ncbi:MAG: hypothetical protein PHD30_07840 [Paludibacter sp.]|jgi:hypothetical protein|nr:hypothetical protein [Paludibacter sp.]MEA5062651.1 hypothetical protein [Petrimonas sp.]